MFGVDLPIGFPDESYPGFNAPLVVKSHKTGRLACGLARFGLIPAWAKDEKISRHTYNARSETAAEKPSYRTPWRQRQFGLTLPLFRVVLSPTVTRPFCAVPRTSVARTASG